MTGGVFVEDSERLGGAPFAKQGKSKVIGCVRRSRIELEGRAELGDRFGRPSLLLEKNTVIAVSMGIARMCGDCAQEVPVPAARLAGTRRGKRRRAAVRSQTSRPL